LKFALHRSTIGDMRGCRNIPALLMVAAIFAAVAACAIPHDVGLAERCAEVMRRAYPAAAIEITKSGASASSLTAILAQVEG
jgi:hypothetical protein